MFFVSFTFGMGLVSAVAPLAAQAFGARDPRMVRRALRVGLWAALLIALPLMALPFRGEQILRALGQEPVAARLAQQYLFGLAWGILPALWFIAIRGFMSAVNRPEPILWITLAAIPANALLVYPLLYGAWGLPQLGLFGAGLATSIVNLGTFLAGLWFTYRRRPFRKYQVLGHIWRIDWYLMRRLAIVGAPISLSFLLEYGLFGAAGLLMGLIGTTALAAHQIALQIAAILFMVPFGISMAATVRVGHAVGRGDPAAVNRAGFVAIGLGIAFMSAMTLAVITGRSAIAEVFLGEATDATARIGGDAVVDRFDVLHRRRHPDGGRRRAARHERHARAAVVRHRQLLADRLRMRARGSGSGPRSARVGVWIGLSCGTAAYAVLLVLRFRLLASRLKPR